MQKINKNIIGGAIGNCVHIGGLYNFLKLAETEGFQTILLGSAIPVKYLVSTAKEKKPAILAISYRLTAETVIPLFEELKNELAKNKMLEQRMIFGGTPPVAEIALKTGLFEKVFNGTETLDEIRRYLSGSVKKKPGETYAKDLLGRIEQKFPYPLLRHHFGRPTLKETLSGITTIAESGVLDIISIGPDQNAQEHFFHPEEMDPKLDGAGGVPIRKPEDLEAIYNNSRCGNFPLIRCYAGTRDLIRWAEMSVSTIRNAWGAIPLCWYSEMDKRSTRLLRDAIAENQKTMEWYALRGIPVEVNESHQWSLRNAHDSLAVTMAFLAAYNAKKMGVRHYISQFMFNTPPGTSAIMDLAKMLAKQEIIETLTEKDFTIYREVRAGLSHFSPDPSIAKGQLAASAIISLRMKPHIYHVVGYSEGDHAALPHELIESCEIVHGVLRNCLHGMPDIANDQEVLKRKRELIAEAHELLKVIRKFGKESSQDPWSDPEVISKAIYKGILDTPHFLNHKNLCGNIKTRLINGGWYAVNDRTGIPVSEKERTSHFIRDIRKNHKEINNNKY